MNYFSFLKYFYILLALFTFSGSSSGVEARFDAIYGYDLNANSLAVEQIGVGQEKYAYDEGSNFIHYGVQRLSPALNQVNIEYESDNRLYDGTTNLCYRCINYSVENLQEKAQDGSFFAFEVGLVAAKGADETVDVFRVFGGDARAQGFSFTTVDPRTVKNFRDAAGLPSGGTSGATNTADFLIKGQARKSDVIKFKSADPLDGNKGGLPELIIDPKNVNITDFSVLKP